MTDTIGQATARLTVQRETLVSGDWLKTSGDAAMPLAGASLADLPIDSHTRWVIEMADEAAVMPAAELERADGGSDDGAVLPPARKTKAA